MPKAKKIEPVGRTTQDYVDKVRSELNDEPTFDETPLVMASLEHPSGLRLQLVLLPPVGSEKVDFGEDFLEATNDLFVAMTRGSFIDFFRQRAEDNICVKMA